MKFMKWKILVKTCIVCLLPILLGVILWERLPDVMAIHFDLNNNPDNFAKKEFVVFFIPFLMVLIQFFCCFINDINAYKHGERKKFETAIKWIIPIIGVILQGLIFGYSLGLNPDMRRFAMLIVGGVFLLIGNYLPKFDYIKNYDVDSEKARKINRFIGIETVIMGVLYIISIFFSPIASIVCLFLLVPYTIISIVYGIKVVKK